MSNNYFYKRFERDKMRCYQPDPDVSMSNPVLTKPSTILTIRQIVMKYSQGDFVSQIMKQNEQVQFDDTIIDVSNYSDDGDKFVRAENLRHSVSDFKAKISSNEHSVEQSVEEDSIGDSKSSE